MKVELLRETFQRAREENGGVTKLGLRFYERLFTKYPQVRPLFNTPPGEQHKKLMASLGAIVAGAEYPATLIPFLHAMGIRHLKYKTENAHYPAVGENLVAVLAEHLSVEGEWTAEMEETWKSALEFVSNTMIEAANDPEKYKPELESAGYLADGFSNRTQKPWEMAGAEAGATHY